MTEAICHISNSLFFPTIFKLKLALYSPNNLLPVHKESMKSVSIVIIRSKQGIRSTRDPNVSLLLMPPLYKAVNDIF